MAFFALVILFVAAALVHGVIARAELSRRLDLVLIYQLAGYNGVVMLGVAIYMLVAPDRVAGMLGAPTDNVFVLFAGIMYLSMSVASIPCIWIRGTYLVGPLITWSLFFLAAVVVHLSDLHGSGHAPSVHHVLIILAAHATTPVVMIGVGLWRLSLSRAPARPGSTGAGSPV